MKLKINSKIIKAASGWIKMIVKTWRDDAITAIEHEEFKAETKSVWTLPGKFNGIAQFLHRTIAVANEVGTVITAFNAWITVQIAAKILIDAGFETVSEAEKSTDKLFSILAGTIRLLFESHARQMEEMDIILRPRAVGRSYKSPIETGKKQHGWKIVRISSKISREIEQSICAIDEILYLDEVYQIALDQSSNKRLSGELTIDSDKKPSPLVIAGILGLSALSEIQQMGKRKMEVKVEWNGTPDIARHDSVMLYSEKVANDSIIGLNGSYDLFDPNKPNDEENKHEIQLLDFVQMLRTAPFQRLTVWAQRIGHLFEDNVQQLPQEELARINACVIKYRESGILAALEALKQEWQTATSTSRAEIKKAGKIKNLLRRQNAEKRAKADRKLQLDALSNKARLTFEKAGVSDAAERVRLVWAVTLNDNRKAHGGQVSWEELSDIPESLLPEEFAVWFYDFMGTTGDDVKNVTRDIIKPCGVLKFATEEQLNKLNGCKVKFEKGVAYSNGKPFMYSNVPLNGVFDIKVEDGKMFAEHDIVSLVEVPAATTTSNFVKLQSVKTEEEITKISDSIMAADEIFIGKGEGNPLYSVNNGKYSRIANYVCPKENVSKCANMALNVSWTNTVQHPGLCGKATFVKVHQYQDKEGLFWFTAFAVLEECRPATYAELIAATQPNKAVSNASAKAAHDNVFDIDNDI